MPVGCGIDTLTRPSVNFPVVQVRAFFDFRRDLAVFPRSVAGIARRGFRPAVVHHPADRATVSGKVAPRRHTASSVGDEGGKPARRSLRQTRTMRQGLVQARHVPRPRHQGIQGLLAQLRAVVAEQMDDRLDVGAVGDGVGDSRAQVGAPGARRSAPTAGLARMMSIRSSSVSTGENSRTGAATMISMSRARRRINSGGASASLFRASARMWRTVGNWS
jgi:hypothetical protein